MSAGPQVVLVAPFWHNPAHVGRLRAQRFVRVLAARGVRVAVVAAGAARATDEHAWGLELTVPDRWNLCREIGGAAASGGGAQSGGRAWRRWLHYLFLYPDRSVLWARQAAADRDVLAACRGARWVISSSPPESAHVAGRRLARRLGARFLMDMRDGWLDEPLKPWLARPGLRRALEGCQERRLLRAAQAVTVTSAGWQQALAARVPAVASRIRVLTNACPPDDAVPPPAPRPSPRADDPLRVLYAGRLTGSSLRRTADLLLHPLLQSAPRGGPPLAIEVMGELTPDDEAWLRAQAEAVAVRGWTLRAAPAVARAAALRAMQAADGLLLLSDSSRAIPSKLFDYLAARRPILAIMPRASALSDLTRDWPQVFPLHPAAGETAAACVARFLDACAVPMPDYGPPAAVTEDAHGARLAALLEVV